MQTERIRKAPNPARHRGIRSGREPLDPANAEPNKLREAVYKALSQLSEDDRSQMRDSILAQLEASGVNLRQHLLVLGIPARTAAELNSPDIAKLIRYVRMNEPKAMNALAPLLSGMLNSVAAVGRGAGASA